MGGESRHMRKRKRNADPIERLRDEANWSTWRSSFRPVQWRGGPLPRNPTLTIILASLLVVTLAVGALFLVYWILRWLGI